MFCPGPGCSGQTGVPFEQQLPGLFLFHFRPLQALEVQYLHDPSLWGQWADSPKVSVGRTISSTWLAGETLPTNTLVGTSMGWALRFLRQIGTQEEPGSNSVCGSQYHRGRQLEASCWLSKHMDPPTVSPDACTAMYVNGPK